MIKILLISDVTGGVGGVYTYIQQINKYISENISVQMLLDLNTTKYVQEFYQFKYVDFVALSNKFFNPQTIYESMKLAINKHKPNLIHIVNGSIKSNLVIREFLIEYNFPFVVTEQFIDSSLVLDKIILSRIQNVNLSANHTIYVSNKNVEIAEKVFNIQTENSTIIYNGIFPVKNRKLNFIEKPNRIFTIGRCVAQKGIDTIIKAIALIPELKIEFSVLGDGEDKNKLLELAKHLFESNHQISIRGWSKGIHYEALTDSYDLYISASRQEGFSYSILEVASAGFPIICSNCSGNEELIRTCNRGNLFDSDDYEQLSKLIKDYLLNPVALNKKAFLETSRVNETFNINLLISDLEKIYNLFIL